MKKFIYTATTLLVLAGSTASAVTIPTTSFSSKTKTQPTQPTQPGTDSIPPNCPWNDKNGCGIYN